MLMEATKIHGLFRHGWLAVKTRFFAFPQLLLHTHFGPPAQSVIGKYSIDHSHRNGRSSPTTASSKIDLKVQ